MPRPGQTIELETPDITGNTARRITNQGDSSKEATPPGQTPSSELQPSIRPRSKLGAEVATRTTLPEEQNLHGEIGDAATPTTSGYTLRAPHRQRTDEAWTEPRGNYSDAMPSPTPLPHHQDTESPPIHQRHEPRRREGARNEGNLFSTTPGPLPRAHRHPKPLSSPYLHAGHTDPGFPHPPPARTAGGGEENPRRRRGNGGRNGAPLLSPLSSL